VTKLSRRGHPLLTCLGGPCDGVARDT
jgi:hypothetical protein